MKTYKIILIATLKSTLTDKQLRDKIALCLYDTQTQESKQDGVDSELEILDYIDTEVYPMSWFDFIDTNTSDVDILSTLLDNELNLSPTD